MLTDIAAVERFLGESVDGLPVGLWARKVAEVYQHPLYEERVAEDIRTARREHGLPMGAELDLMEEQNRSLDRMWNRMHRQGPPRRLQDISAGEIETLVQDHIERETGTPHAIRCEAHVRGRVMDITLHITPEESADKSADSVRDGEPSHTD
jgi:hypothetical protein